MILTWLLGKVLKVDVRFSQAKEMSRKGLNGSKWLKNVVRMRDEGVEVTVEDILENATANTRVGEVATAMILAKRADFPITFSQVCEWDAEEADVMERFQLEVWKWRKGLKEG